MRCNNVIKLFLIYNWGTMFSLCGVPQTLNKANCPTIAISNHILGIMKSLLCFVETFSLSVFLLSFTHHMELYSLIRDFSITEKYFFNVLTESYGPGNDKSQPLIYYGGYKYVSTMLHFPEREERGWLVMHRLMQAVTFLFGNKVPSPDPNYVFCNLHAFPEVLGATNVKATPDNHYSLVILAISTFSWGIYLLLLVGTFILEKNLFKVKITPTPLASLMRSLPRYMSNVSTKVLAPVIVAENLISRKISKVVSGCRDEIALAICLVVFILSVFGGCVFRNTKLEQDNFCVCMWEMAKLGLIIVNII